DLRSTQLLAAELVARLRAGGAQAQGWRYSDPALLEAQGVRSIELVPVWVERLFPALDGLCEALDASTASFLDVGTGVGRLAIAMCEQYPVLRVVGLDPFDTPLALARRNVADAGLEDRIELRPNRCRTWPTRAATTWLGFRCCSCPPTWRRGDCTGYAPP